MKILRVAPGLYDDMRRAFRLHGALGTWWWSYNGLVQGDPISMVMLNSLVTCVVETSDSLTMQHLRVRSYANDLSAVVRGDSKESVCRKLRAVHAVMRGYVASGCGELNDKKCFTFGDQDVQPTPKFLTS